MAIWAMKLGAEHTTSSAKEMRNYSHVLQDNNPEAGALLLMVSTKVLETKRFPTPRMTSLAMVIPNIELVHPIGNNLVVFGQPDLQGNTFAFVGKQVGD